MSTCTMGDFTSKDLDNDQEYNTTKAMTVEANNADPLLDDPIEMTHDKIINSVHKIYLIITKSIIKRKI